MDSNENTPTVTYTAKWFYDANVNRVVAVFPDHLHKAIVVEADCAVDFEDREGMMRLAKIMAAGPVMKRRIEAALIACKYQRCDDARENLLLALEAIQK